MTRRFLGLIAPLGALIVVSGFPTAVRADSSPAQPAAPKVGTPPPSPVVKSPDKVPPPVGTSAVVMDVSAIESVVGKAVKDPGGEDLGRIVDLLVTPSGQVRAAIIDFGGILGVGSRKVAVDWKALDFINVTKDATIRLALTRNQVRVSPEYKSGDPVVILQATKPDETKPPTLKSPTAGAPAAPKP